MRTFRVFALKSVVAGLLIASAVTVLPASAQTAADAALDMANMLDGAGGGVSDDDLMSALKASADAGQPMALYRLGSMYENGEGVEKDPVKAFGYYSQIANEHADTPPRSVEADIVAQSFVKVGDYYRDGLPGAGIKADAHRSHALLMHAATYFGDADAQFRVGQLYLEKDGLGYNPLQSARWMSLAARKGHPSAQAMLGNMLFNGDGIDPQPIEGLMWLSLAQRGVEGTGDEAWVEKLVEQAMLVAEPIEREQATQLANTLEPQFDGL